MIRKIQSYFKIRLLLALSDLLCTSVLYCVHVNDLTNHIEHNNLKAFQRLISEEKNLVNASDFYGFSLLRKDRIEAAELLLSSGADVNAIDKEFVTPLHLAKSISMARILHKNGANINARDEEGATPLHMAEASRSREKGLLQFLLDNGANINAQDKKGWTALHDTAYPNKAIPESVSHTLEMANILLNNIEIDFTIKNGADESALEIAQREDNQKFITLAETKVKEHYRTARALFLRIKMAIRKNKLKYLEGLLKNNVKLASMLRDGNTGNTILHQAFFYKKAKAVELIAKHIPQLLPVANNQGLIPLQRPNADRAIDGLKPAYIKAEAAQSLEDAYNANPELTQIKRAIFREAASIAAQKQLNS